MPEVGKSLISITPIGSAVTPIEVNNASQGDVTNGVSIDIDLFDSIGNTVSPLSVSKVGNNINLTVTPNPSGVYFQIVAPEQRTSFRTGDEGWRFQNNWWDRVNPSLPSKFSELDLSLGLNAWWTLKTPLTVGGVSSTVRFVDVDGLQVFPTADNKNAVVIDKLTGLMYSRFPVAPTAVNWNSNIDNALNFSVTVNSIVYDDWFLASFSELTSIFNMETFGDLNFNDAISSVRLINIGGTMFSSTTYRTTSANAITFAPNTRLMSQTAKTGTGRPIYVRKAYNLIS